MLSTHRKGTDIHLPLVYTESSFLLTTLSILPTFFINHFFSRGIIPQYYYGIFIQKLILHLQCLLYTTDHVVLVQPISVFIYPINICSYPYKIVEMMVIPSTD